jgi:uncharacterized linocin/CFP29 family protein
MTADNSQVPWTDEQWARVNQVIQEEASRARVAATLLPLYGPLPADTDFVRAGSIAYPALPPPDFRQQPDQIEISDTDTIKLATLQVKVYVRGAQMADPEMTSALTLFRRAANVLARLEDAVVFRGLIANPVPPPSLTPGGTGGLPQIWEILGGQALPGLLTAPGYLPVTVGAATGPNLVVAVVNAIGQLEQRGYFGPFAVVLDQRYFLQVQTPAVGMIRPQDQIIPFLGGGPLLRSSSLPADRGLVIALGGAPVELVVSSDMALQFLQLTNEPKYLFRVYEKMALRIREAGAIALLS